MKCPPPKGFKPAGAILWCRYSPVPPPFARTPRRRTGRRMQGVRYEQKGHEHYMQRFGTIYVPNPWFLFQEEEMDRPRWCQPDALLINADAGTIHILEFKLQHTSNAWWQLRQLYFPIIKFLFPPELWNIALCEIVKWYDPATAFPETVMMAAHPELVRPEKMGVHIWKP